MLEEGLGAEMLGLVIAPLYQPQDSINGHAEHLARNVEILNAPLDGYESALKSASELADQRLNEVLPPRSVYNPVGRVVLGIGDHDLERYGARVADIEGVRRAALLAVTLRAEGVEPANVPAAMSQSVLRNPYNDRPFEWDAENRAIVFQGLEKSDRGRHSIRY